VYWVDNWVVGSLEGMGMVLPDAEYVEIGEHYGCVFYDNNGPNYNFRHASGGSNVNPFGGANAEYDTTIDSHSAVDLTAEYSLLEQLHSMTSFWEMRPIYEQYWQLRNPGGDSRPAPLQQATLDSLRNDFSGEADSIRIITRTSSETWPDSLIIAFGTQNYPDSASPTRIRRAYSGPNRIDTSYIVMNLNEPALLFASFWIMDSDSGWSYRQTRTRLFNHSIPRPGQLPQISLDSLFNDFAGESDSVRIITATSSENWPDSIIMTFSTQGYPDSSVQNGIRIVYPGPNSIDTSFLVISLNEPAALYGSFWVRDSNAGWSFRQTRNRLYYSIPSGITEPILPHETALHQNYPNPFNASTEIRFTLAQPGHVDLQIFNVGGQSVANLINEYHPAGEYSMTWDAEDLSSGVYFAVMQTDNIRNYIAMVILK
jgi:hypothetical protein